jgi:signal transduction histidine kinase
MTRPASVSPVVEDALREWRRRVTSLAILASLSLHVPLLAVFLTGRSPVGSFPLKATSVIGVAVLAVAACAYRASHELRAWVMLAVLYVFALVGIVSVPQGPYIRALPIIAPMIAIGLLGVGAARICLAISAVLFVFAPSLHGLPALAPYVVASGPPVRSTSFFLQGLALTAEMVLVMVLMERFYGFLLQSLIAERQAADERGAAYRQLEDAMLERRRLEHEIARIGDEERRRLGTEVHDGVCQQLTGALLRCQALERRVEQGTPTSADELGAISSILGETIHEAHAVAQGLCPLEPTPDALAPALRSMTKRAQQMSGVPCEFLSEGDVSVPDPSTAHHLFRLAQEALSNAVHHARAGRIVLALRGRAEGLTVEVEDNGVGMPAIRTSGGMGLRTMAARARLLEGQFTIGPLPGGGTRVSCCAARTPRHERHPPIAQEDPS